MQARLGEAGGQTSHTKTLHHRVPVCKIWDYLMQSGIYPPPSFGRVTLPTSSVPTIFIPPPRISQYPLHVGIRNLIFRAGKATYRPPPKSRAQPTNSRTTPTAAAKAMTTNLKKERSSILKTQLSQGMMLTHMTSVLLQVIAMSVHSSQSSVSTLFLQFLMTQHAGKQKSRDVNLTFDL